MGGALRNRFSALIKELLDPHSAQSILEREDREKLPRSGPGTGPR